MELNVIDHNLNSIKTQIETIFKNHEEFIWSKHSRTPLFKDVKLEELT